MDSSSRFSPVHQLATWLNNEIATLYPGCFALVMATGIISNALFFEGYRDSADALFAVNLVAYPCLVLLTVLRFACFSRALWADLINPRLGFSFFTIVAGTDVFGVGINLRGFASVALLMWLFALIVWFMLIYFSFAVLIFLNTARGANVVHGGWLIAIVGTESLVILGTIVAPGMGGLSAAVFVLIHMLWGVGLGLYGIFVTLFAYRIFFFDGRHHAAVVGGHGRRRNHCQRWIDAHPHRERHVLPTLDATVH
jgi:tellurite resistance protein TehA-like permease